MGDRLRAPGRDGFLLMSPAQGRTFNWREGGTGFSYGLKNVGLRPSPCPRTHRPTAGGPVSGLVLVVCGMRSVCSGGAARPCPDLALPVAKAIGWGADAGSITHPVYGAGSLQLFLWILVMVEPVAVQGCLACVEVKDEVEDICLSRGEQDVASKQVRVTIGVECFGLAALSYSSNK